MVNDKTRKIKIINYNTIIYSIAFLILVLSTIYFISKAIGNTSAIIESNGTYNIDQVNAINAVANSVVGKVNNTIAVSAIFFTVIVASISVFQFIKIKDLDTINEKTIIEAEEIKGELEKNRRGLDLLKEEYRKLDYLRNELEKKSARIQVDFNMHKIDDFLDNLNYKKGGFDFNRFKDLIQDTIKIGDRYPGILTNIEKAELQFTLIENCYMTIYDYISSIEELYKVLNIVENEECDGFKFNIYKDMILLANENNDHELSIKIIEKMGSSMDETIEEIINDFTCAYNSIDISKIENKYNELEYYFGDKFLQIFIKEIEKDYFINIREENNEFKKFLMEFIDKKIKENNK